MKHIRISKLSWSWRLKRQWRQNSFYTW